MGKFVNLNGVKDLTNATKDDLRAEFTSIQVQISGIICEQVIKRGGVFFSSYTPPKNEDIKCRSLAQRDDRPFNTLRASIPSHQSQP